MTIKSLLLTISVFIMQLVFLPAFAVRAYPDPVSITQPDSSVLTVLMHGDEFHHFQTTEDNYLIRRNARGYYNYTTITGEGEIINTNYKARDIDQRTNADIQFLNTIDKANLLRRVQDESLTTKISRLKSQSQNVLPQRTFPTAGPIKSLVILVNFSDVSFVTESPGVAFENLLNQEGYTANEGTGSARDYFMAGSYGKFTPAFDVVGPFTLPNNMEFYGANNSAGVDVNPVQMVIDACAAANESVDFAQYDSDNNGAIDNVFIFYAGYNEAEQGEVNSIWPHSWYVTHNSSHTGGVADITFDEKLLMDYACTSELTGNTGSNMCGIGTFCHEFSHVLGLPDYYDTSGTQKNALNYWSLMDLGAYNNKGRTPPTFSVYDRFYLGYLTPEQVSSTSNLTLLPIYQGKTKVTNTTNQAFLFSDTIHDLNRAYPSPSEFFMVEYRKKTGWDTYLPGEGMCIWHVDYIQSYWINNRVNFYTGVSQTLSSHMHVYLIPPTGVGTTPPTTAFTTGSVIPTTWVGKDINRRISNIQKTESNISFTLTVPFQSVIKVGIIGSQLRFAATKLNATNSKMINIKTTGLNSDLIVKISGANAELFSVSVSSILKNYANGDSGFNVGVNYSPTTLGNHTATLTISGGGLNPAKVIALNGEGL